MIRLDHKNTKIWTINCVYYYHLIQYWAEKIAFMIFCVKCSKILESKNADNLCRLTLTCNWHQVTCVCKQIKFKPALVCEITKNSFLHILLIFFILIFPTKHYILKCEFDVYAPLPLSKYNRFKSRISIQKKIFSPFKPLFVQKLIL